MKKLLIGGGILGVLAVVVLLGSLATGVFALGTTPPAPSQATLTPEEAEGLAATANPGTTAVKVEQDEEDGVPVYEVELENGLEVQVEANSGAILGTENEGADLSEATTTTPAGPISDGLLIKETLLDGAIEYKVYAAGLGVVEERADDAQVNLVLFNRAGAEPGRVPDSLSTIEGQAEDIMDIVPGGD